ncbi:hypothetical protein VCR3J2_350200 [Vibrio coralliirubri]|uniref:Uncharacterized protein n=1 Tax=Vibrio coralliirubri TaxID=1516159 RepID=A0AA86WZ03_9VIBR|nr:hypothetical protein VCR6J2_190093 [Vibrio coralliirubri]CDT73945.1 hypothetical protein VCR31J2_1300080 [Vibrio coralliirubri]CDT91070.1 hypothetical protein VCR3J2_350200 [Vibrio coralliirubri]CDU04713.1 hypothetical protein VCR12J2_640239 [Vibrio coralliirubri]
MSLSADKLVELLPLGTHFLKHSFPERDSELLSEKRILTERRGH